MPWSANSNAASEQSPEASRPLVGSSCRAKRQLRHCAPTSRGCSCNSYVCTGRNPRCLRQELAAASSEARVRIDAAGLGLGLRYGRKRQGLAFSRDPIGHPHPHRGGPPLRRSVRQAYRLADTGQPYIRIATRHTLAYQRLRHWQDWAGRVSLQATGPRLTHTILQLRGAVGDGQTCGFGLLPPSSGMAKAVRMYLAASTTDYQALKTRLQPTAALRSWILHHNVLSQFL